MWKNQYIDLISSKPELIFPCAREARADVVREKLRAKSQRFKKVYCELGSGSGAHLVALASANPDTLCVGFEIRFKRSFKTAEKAEKKSLQNVAIVHCDARRVGEFFSEESLDAVFVNFPDPWEKAGWQKHRLLRPETLRQILALLKPGAFFRYKTDHSEYFSETEKFLETLPGTVISKLTRDLYHSELLDMNISSEFEELFKSKEVPVNLLELKKLG